MEVKRSRAKLALVGLGTWARSGHLPVYLGRYLSSKIEVAALCSRDLQKAQRWANDFDVPHAYDDFDRMLATVAPDIVSVCTADPFHSEYVVKALESGCHLLVEKPLATSLSDCKKIEMAARTNKRMVLTLYHKRADPLWRDARQRIQSGVYGKLQAGLALIENPIRVPNGQYFSSNFTDYSNINWFLGTHFYDLIRFLTGLNPRSVLARSYYGSLLDKGHNTPDSFKVDMVLEGGASVSFLLAWNNPSGPSLTKQNMCLHFEAGEVELDGTRRGFIEHGPNDYAYRNPYFLLNSGTDFSGYGATYLKAAVDVLLGESPIDDLIFSTVEDSAYATAIAEAVETSINSGREVSVPDVNFDNDLIV